MSETSIRMLACWKIQYKRCPETNTHTSPSRNRVPIAFADLSQDEILQDALQRRLVGGVVGHGDALRVHQHRSADATAAAGGEVDEHTGTALPKELCVDL